MANVIIKSDERKANTAAVLQAYGGGNATASERSSRTHCGAFTGSLQRIKKNGR